MNLRVPASSSRWRFLGKPRFRKSAVSWSTGTNGCRRWPPFGLTCLALLWLNGCAGYHVGPVNGLEAREKSVQINPFPNKTLEPRLTDAVTHELRRELQRDGTFQLATHGDGDIILAGTITRYHRNEVTIQTGDALTVRDYRLTLTAQVSARERSTGRLLFDQQVTGYTIIRVQNDLTSTERQASPLLADDLAKNIIALLSEGKW
jgi:hypothetical protein